MKDYIDTIHRMFDDSGAIILKHFRRRVEVEQKGDDTPVTVADKQAEAAIRTIIREVFPEHGILGEEEGAENENAEYLWVIDPIDGTRNFIAGKPLFTTLIALCRKGRPILGAVHQPFTSERWIGSREGAQCNSAPIAVRPCAKLEEAWIATTSPHLFSAEGFEGFERLRLQCRESLYGGDAYHYAMLAQGQIDLVVEEGLKFHDIAALIPLIEAAGGQVTNWQGESLSATNGVLHVIASGDAALHKKALDALKP